MSGQHVRSLAAGLGLMAVASGLAAADEYALIRARLALCATCHGERGAPRQPSYPILAGQHLYYLYVQLKDFKSGRRQGAEMSPIAALLDKQEMLLLARYFSEQRWPRTGYRAESKVVARGEAAAAAGQCVQCHRGGYEGDSRIPRLAGQMAGYLKKTMLDFKAGARANSPAKSSLMASFSDQEIAALAAYLADL